MAPFPETEIMTLKRLEVALKKGDYKLLRDGTYKLHEKYHSGYEFEYVDLLQDILYNANNSNAPSEIKDILIPTLEDILSISNTSHMTSPYNSTESSRVSTLTSLEYGNQIQNQEQIQENKNEEDKLSAFDVFSAEKAMSTTDNPISNNDYISGNIQNQNPGNYSSFDNENNDENRENNETNTLNEYHQEAQEETSSEEIQQTFTQSPTDQEVQVINKTQTISIFYAQNNSDDKNKNIKKYTEMVSKLQNEKTDFSEILGLISEINMQSNANVAELASILEQLQNRNIKINLITNSTNANVAGLVENMKIPYKFNSTEEKINVLPLFGLTNMFKCTQCKEEYIDLNDNINPYVIQCPKCKHPMLPNVSSMETKMNLDFYNNSIINLASSDAWLILYPSAAESSMLDMMKSALSLNKNVENIYICDKDINTKENYKNTFNQINEKVNVNIEINVMEEFLKSV